jgi:LysM repeat protein
MQRDIEIQSKQIAEKQKEMLSFVAEKTVGSKSTGKSAEEDIPIAKSHLPANTYVIHKVQQSDTLDRICLIYDVPKDAIRKANQFTGDEIYMKKELIIPHSSKNSKDLYIIVDGPLIRAGDMSAKSDEQRKKE